MPSTACTLALARRKTPSPFTVKCITRSLSSSSGAPGTCGTPASAASVAVVIGVPSRQAGQDLGFVDLVGALQVAPGLPVGVGGPRDQVGQLVLAGAHRYPVDELAPRVERAAGRQPQQAGRGTGDGVQPGRFAGH